MANSARVLALVIVVYLFSTFVYAVEKGACAFDPIKTDPKHTNVFAPDQEVFLGDILAEVGHMNATVVEDEELTRYLNVIGNRLIKQLPQTNLNFRFFLSDAPYANAFSIAGGRVYVTRKLIGFAHNEDELAAVMAHELGHIVTHQQAVLFTKIFKAQIGVTEFKDRKDLENKFQEMLESKKSMSIFVQQEQEEADRVGIDILVRAGYRVEAMSEFWDRFTANKGRKGNWFTDMVGATGEPSERFRGMLKETVKLPDLCIEKRDPNSEQEFKNWQKAVIAYDRQHRHEDLPGLLAKKQLEPPLQDQIHTLRFSPDGKYLIAQDNATIYVLTRDPFRVKFLIPARDAFPAQFTSDSKFLTLYTSDLRIETWDIEKESPSAVYDMHSAHSCLQTALTRDGKILACIDDHSSTLTLIDTATQDHLFEKKDVRSSSFSGGWGLAGLHFSYEIDYINLAFSPDSKYLIASGKDGTWAIDVAARKEISLPGSLKTLTKFAFTFLDENRVFGLADASGAKAEVASFPQGDIQQNLEFGAAIPSSTTKPGYILMRPIRDFEVGVLDLKSGQIVRANKKPAMDLWGDFAASELGSGEVGLFGNSTLPVARTTLPRGGFANIRAAVVSEDFRWLALAEEERGAIWNLENAQRVYNVKSFQGAYFASDGAYVDFPKQEKVERSVARLSLSQPAITLAAKLGPGRMRQVGPYIIAFKRNDGDKPDKDPSEFQDIARFNRYRYEGKTLRWNFNDIYNPNTGFSVDNTGITPTELGETLNVSDARTGTLLWSRMFEKDVPHLYPNPDAGVIAFCWRVGEPGAKAEFDKYPILAAKRNRASDNDYLLEVASLRNGEILAGMVLHTNDGTFALRGAVATQNWAAFADTFGRTLVYNLKTSVCTGKIFGLPDYLAPDSTQLVIQYDSRHFALFNTQTMVKQADYTFSDPVDYLRVSATGDRLFAISDTQTTYVVNTAVAPKQDSSLQAK